MINALGETWVPPLDAAHFVSQTAAPTAAVAPTAVFNETVIFSNGGGTPWLGSHTMSIAASAQSGAQIFPAQSFALGSAQTPVNPGQSTSQTFAVHAPAQPGTYDLAFVLHNPAGQLLAASPTQQIVVAAPNTAVNNASLTIVSAPGSLPNGVPGSVTVAVLNTGTTIWSSPTYSLRLGRGLRLSLPQPSAPVVGSVAPGVSQALTFGIVCNGQGQGWLTAQMAESQNGVFGQRVSRTVVCQP